MTHLETSTNTTNQAIGEKLYDLCMIDQLCRGNQEQVKKMVNVFISQVPKAVEEIKSAYQNKDFTAVKNVAHRIKPTLSYYAIVKIAKDMLQIEALAEQGFATAELEMRIKKLDDVTAEVVTLMKKDFLFN